MKESVRIVVLNYQTAAETIALVKQLEQQVFDNLEIVVVDNDSSTEDKAKLSQSLPSNIHLIFSDTNLGYAAGNNLGLRFQRGQTPDYQLVLNSDIGISDPLFIQKMVDGFKIDSQFPILASSPLVNTSSSIAAVGYQIQVRKLLRPFQMIWLSFSLFKKLSPKLFKKFIYAADQPYENKYLFCDTINGAAFMIRQSILEKMGYLDQGTFLFHEELILGKQIQVAGGTCLLNGFVSIHHQQGLSTGSNKKQFNAVMERYKYQSEIHLYQKYYLLSPLVLKLFGLLKEIEILLKSILRKIQ